MFHEIQFISFQVTHSTTRLSYTGRHTDTHTFSKNCQIVPQIVRQDIPKRINTLKAQVQIFYETNTFILLIQMKLKIAQQPSLASFVHINHINIIFYCKYFIFKILCDSMQSKLRSVCPKISRKSGRTASSVEQFPTKIDKYLFQSRCN